MFVQQTSYHHKHIRILNLILEERAVQRLSMAIKVYTHVDAYHHKYKISRVNRIFGFMESNKYIFSCHIKCI